MKTNTLIAVIIACVTLFCIALTGALLVRCENQSDRRAECAKSKSALDCKVLFPLDGDH